MAATDSSPDRPIIGLTGATGFVGRRLSHHLHQAGYRLRLLARPQTDPGPLAALPNAELIRGSLEDAPSLAELCLDCHMLIHCAATIRGGDWRHFYQANVLGTNNLLAAMQRRGCRYLVHLSSIAAREPHLSWYARSKHLAEAQVQASGLPALVLRAPALYGPGDRELRPLLDMLFRGGPALRVTPARQRLSLLHVDDLCAAIEKALERQPVGIHEIDDGREEGYDWRTICAQVSHVSGRKIRTVPLPGALLHGIAHANLIWSRLARRRPMLTPGKARELRWPDWQARGTGLPETLAWEPRLRFREGLQSLYAPPHSPE